MTPTLTQILTALQNLAMKKGRTHYELCTAKQVKFALENGLDHHLIEELRGLIQERTIPKDITQDKKVSHARLTKRRVYPTREQEIEVISWLNNCGYSLPKISRVANCGGSTLSLIRRGKQKFTMDVYNKIVKARKELEGMAV